MIEIVNTHIENPETNGITVDGDRIEITGVFLDPKQGRIVIDLE